MTAIDPTAHLSAEQIEELGRELDAIRDEVIASRGEKDAAYIRKVISAQRKLELVSRGVLLFSFFPPACPAPGARHQPGRRQLPRPYRAAPGRAGRAAQG
ncbi:hypothetical protein ACWEWQ_41135, partial [Streptomyces sp. NPDC003832]